MLHLASTSEEALTDLLMNCEPHLRDSSLTFPMRRKCVKLPFSKTGNLACIFHSSIVLSWEKPQRLSKLLAGPRDENNQGVRMSPREILF